MQIGVNRPFYFHLSSFGASVKMSEIDLKKRDREKLDSLDVRKGEMIIS